MNFIEKYKTVRKEKNSILCIGLDPMVKEDPVEFCMDIIEQTSDYASAVKTNSQFILFSVDARKLRKLNRRIHDEGIISILDHKLSDITSSNIPALHSIRDAGFDALTFSPFAGNIRETVENAHKDNLGLFVLTLMSNPEAVWIQKETRFREKPLYLEIARRAGLSRADGVVVGATVDVNEIRGVREVSGDSTIFLCPGVGEQGGDFRKVIRTAGKNLLLNVGRAIINHRNPGKKAEEFWRLFNRFR